MLFFLAKFFCDIMYSRRVHALWVLLILNTTANHLLIYHVLQRTGFWSPAVPFCSRPRPCFFVAGRMHALCTCADWFISLSPVCSSRSQLLVSGDCLISPTLILPTWQISKENTHKLQKIQSGDTITGRNWVGCKSMLEFSNHSVPLDDNCFCGIIGEQC